MSEPYSQKASWDYQFENSTLDRRTGRETVMAPLCSKLQGVDGNHEGGLRPFAGFRKVQTSGGSDYELDFQGDSNHNETSVVTDFFPVVFLKQSNDFCRGFVYRAQRKGIGASPGAAATSGDIFIDFWDSSSDTWTGGTKILDDVSLTEPMSVSSWGRFVYVSIRGEDSAVFYYDSGTSSFTTDSPAGPGKRIPVLVEDGISSPAVETDTPTTEFLSGTAMNEVGHLTVVLIDNDDEAALPTDQQSSGDEPAILLDPGSYSVAIRLLDSNTGRRTAISEIAEVYEENFTLQGGVAEVNYMGVRIVWDSSKFDKAEIFRSVRVEDLGSTMGARIIHSVKTIVLADYAYDNTGAPDYTTGVGDNNEGKQALYFFELDDVATSWQPPYMDNRLFDEEVPQGGATTIIDNTLFVGNIANVGNSLSDEETEGDKDRRIAQLRWSSTVELSPELFSPTGYYNLENPGAEVLALTELAGNALGFSKDRQYHIRREGRYIVVHELHKGYGITGPHAHATVASMCYFMTDKGLKSVGANGQLDDVRAVNRIILKEWQGELNDVTMALDGSQSCLYVLNPTRGEAICMWFNTGKMTTLTDLPFTQCKSGYWPISESGNKGIYELEPRAFFLQNAPKDDFVDVITGWKPRIFVSDYRRARTIGSGTGSAYTRNTLMDFAGDARFTVDGAVTSSGAVTISNSGVSVPTADVEGAWIYVVDSTTSSFIGEKGQIHDVSGLVFQLTDATAANFDGLPDGSRIVISPVKFEVVAAPLDQRAETGEVTGRSRFHVRHVDAMGAFFSEVSGYPTADGSSDAAFTGLLYKTEGVTAPEYGYPYDEDQAKVANVREGEGLRWVTFGEVNENSGQFGVDATVFCPGVQILCPDLDFTLLSMEAVGKMQGTRTTEEPDR